METFALFVIGGGPGGYSAAIRAAKLGLRVALAEKDALGGTCLNRGCVPTKALLHSSSTYRAAKHWESIGLKTSGLSFDIQGIYKRMGQIVAQQRDGVAALLKANGVTVMCGEASIVADHQVSVNGELFTCDNILVATGSRPALLPIPGADLPGVVTSDDLLKGLGVMYPSMVIIGGGVIGCEMASFYADLGCEVTILEAQPRLLPLLDEDLGSHLQTLFKRRKITVRCDALVQRITGTPGELTVTYGAKGKAKDATAAAVLLATGRWPVTDGLFAEGVEPARNGRFLQVDKQFKTSLPDVYAIGDVIGGMQLAHKAMVEGQAVAYNLAGMASPTDPGLVPSAVYTEPEIAAAGPTEAELQAAGVRYKKGVYQTLGNARSQIEQADRGFVKILVEEETGRLLAVHMICSRASDLISAFTPHLAAGSGYEDLLRGMRPHPSFSEAVTEALEAVDGGAIHIMP